MHISGNLLQFFDIVAVCIQGIAGIEEREKIRQTIIGLIQEVHLYNLSVQFETFSILRSHDLTTSLELYLLVFIVS